MRFQGGGIVIVDMEQIQPKTGVALKRRAESSVADAHKECIRNSPEDAKIPEPSLPQSSMTPTAAIKTGFGDTEYRFNSEAKQYRTPGRCSESSETGDDLSTSLESESSDQLDSADPSALDAIILNEFLSFARLYLISNKQIEEFIQDGVTEVPFPLCAIITLHGIPQHTTIQQVRGALEKANYQIVIMGADDCPMVLLPVPGEDWLDLERPEPEDDDDDEIDKLCSEYEKCTTQNIIQVEIW